MCTAMEPRPNARPALRHWIPLLAAAAPLALGGCAAPPPAPADTPLPAPTTLQSAVPAASGAAPAPAASATPAPAAAEVAAQAPKQVTGVALSRSGRVFLNFPRWVDEPTPSVAEVKPDGSLEPYPSAAWNQWDKAPGASAKKRFVCVQSVFVDATDTLWILDPASPGFQGVVPGGAKLVRVSLASGQVEKVYPFGASVAPTQSYLNDVRIAKGHALMTDSGLGAIVVLDLATGAARRLLAGHPSTKAEPGVVPVIGGQPWRRADGTASEVHSDGIAVDPRGEHLYYQALTGKTLYRVPIAALLDTSLSAEALGTRVERVATTQPTDGIEFDAQGNLYLTAIEDSAIKVLRPDGRLTVLAQSPDFAWPDSIAISGDTLLFTASQIHRMPGFNGGKDLRRSPYQIYRLRLGS